MSRLQTRRKVLSSLVAAGGCFAGMDLKALVAHAATQGKPLLTSKSLTALMRTPGAYAELAREPGSSLVPFLNRKFALTARQIAEIETIPPRDVIGLKQAVAREADKEKESSDAGFFKKIIGKKSDEKEKASARKLQVKTHLAGGRLTIEVQEVGDSPSAKTATPPSGGLLQTTPGGFSPQAPSAAGTLTPPPPPPRPNIIQ